MGQSLKKLTPGSEQKTMEKIASKYYDEKIKGVNLSLPEFSTAVSEVVEEINKSLGYTQFIIPKTATLQSAYDDKIKKRRHKQDKMTKEEFVEVLKEVITKTGVTNIGASKDILLYLFGVPLTTLFIKQRLLPNVIPNEIFIPGVTSATVFVLAKLNKI